MNDVKQNNKEKMVYMKGDEHGVFTEQVRFKNISKKGGNHKQFKGTKINIILQSVGKGTDFLIYEAITAGGYNFENN